MDRNKLSLRSNEGRYLWVGFAIAIVAGAVVAFTSYSDITRNYNWIDWITHTGKVLETLDAARGDSFISVTALQTYFQTGDRKNLDQLAVSVSDLQRKSAALRALTRDNASQQRRLDQVDQAGRRLGTLAHEVIRIAPTLHRGDALKAPIFEEFSATLYQLGAQFDPMSAAEQALLMDRTAKARTASRRGAMVMGLGGSIVFVWLLLVGGYSVLITNRLKQTAHALLISQEQLARAAERKKGDDRFRALLDSAPDPIVIVSQDGRIALVNAQAEKLFGYARAELLGNTVEMLVPPRFRNLHPEYRSRYFADPKVRAMGAGLELYGLRKDNSEFPIEISLSPIETEDGTLVSSAIRDITERKRAVEEMRQLNETERRHAAQLAFANKELEAFSYSVSHDLRAPLRSIDGFSLALLEDYGGKLDAEAKGLLDRIRAATRRMGQLIDDLLNLARVTRSEMRHKVVDLSAMAKSILAELQSGDPQRRVECVVPTDVIAYGDPRLLRVVLENLLGNAWKFTMNKPQARIELGVSHQDGAPVYFVRDDGPASTWPMSINCSAPSSGCTRRPSSPAPGSVWPRFNESSIATEARPGLKGRWARVRLSRLPFQSMQRNMKQNMKEDVRVYEKKVILLVEDNPDDEALTLRALKKNNITNDIVVGDGVESVDYLFGTGTHDGRDPNALPQIVLLDLKLPKIDGFEVLMKLRADERTKLLPVVILTSSKEQQDIVHGYGLGANSYVRKPVDFEQFVEAVRQLGLYWLVLNEKPPNGVANSP